MLTVTWKEIHMKINKNIQYNICYDYKTNRSLKENNCAIILVYNTKLLYANVYR